MKNPTLILEHKEAKKERLLALAEQIPGAWIGIKIAALLLVLEGQRSGWITEVLGLTRMSLSRWIHGVTSAMFSTTGVPETNVNPIPEPATILLLGSGLVGLAGFARRKFKK